MKYSNEDCPKTNTCNSFCAEINGCKEEEQENIDIFGQMTKDQLIDYIKERSKIMAEKKEIQIMKSYEDGFRDGYIYVGHVVGQREVTVSDEFYNKGIRIGIKALDNLLKRFVSADVYIAVRPYMEHVIESHGGTLKEEEEDIKYEI